MQYNFDYFISYAHADNQSEDGKPGFVDEFVEKLRNSPEHRQMFGENVSVFFDKTEIHDMSDWDNRIRSSLAHSRFFVVLLSPNYFKSRYCAKEFDWWMKHEMHRRVLGEGAAPMLIVAVNDVYNFNVNPLPDIPEELQAEFPNWLNQLRKIQSGSGFDMHDLERAKIDDALQALRQEIKDKVFKQRIAEESPINAGYPKYNENFVGRREELRLLRKTLSESNSTAISAVNGLGGIGKTELALTYGHAFAWDYELGRVFAKCENKDSIENVILSCGIAEMHGVELKGTDEQQLTTLFNTLKRKIKVIEQRNADNGSDKTLGAHLLLILDNVNQLGLISQGNLDIIPDFFHVIITTRESSISFPHIHTESVGRLSEDESVELLSNLRSFGDAPQESVAARKIAQLLDGFTLAVELTGAFLKKSPRVTYQKQCERLVANLSDAVQLMADKTQYLRRHQAECISKVLESTLLALSSTARNALNFAAQMSPDAVALGWIPELLGLDEDESFETSDELIGYNLLCPLAGEPNIARIHRLVADAVNQDVSEEEGKEIISKIREKCSALLKKEETFWYASDNSWNIIPVSEFLKLLAERWTVEASEEEIDWNLTWMLGIAGNILNSLGKKKDSLDERYSRYEICQNRANVFPENVYVQRDLIASFNGLGSMEQAVGNTSAAREWYQQTLKTVQKLDSIPIQIQRDLSISYNNLGDVEKTVGNIAAAREWYMKTLEIRLKLVDAMPEDVQAQRDLNSSYERLGSMERAVGNIAAAREWNKKSLTIARKLVDVNPENVDVQRDLSVSYCKLGDLEASVGNIGSARKCYEKYLEITQNLADAMPENVQAGRDLSISYSRLGDMELKARNIDAAKKWFEKALEISQKQADKMPEDVHVQRELSTFYERLGEVERSVGNIDAARKCHTNAMETSQKLTDKMPENVEVQRDLGVSFLKLGFLERETGNFDAAREWYEKYLKNSQRLADVFPEDAAIQRDLNISCERLGEMERSAGNIDAARKWYQKAVEVAQKLVDVLPKNVEALRDLSASCECLGDLELSVGNSDAARKWYEKTLEIAQILDNVLPKNVDALCDLSISYMKLGDTEFTAGNNKAAKEWYEKYLDVARLLVRTTPENDFPIKDFFDALAKLAKIETQENSAQE